MSEQGSVPNCDSTSSLDRRATTPVFLPFLRLRDRVEWRQRESVRVCAQDRDGHPTRKAPSLRTFVTGSLITRVVNSHSSVINVVNQGYSGDRYLDGAVPN